MRPAQFNEPLYKEVFGITKHIFLDPGVVVKYMEKTEPRHKEISLCRTYVASPKALRYVKVPL